MNKEFLHMQKLAGLITESEYKRALLTEATDQIPGKDGIIILVSDYAKKHIMEHNKPGMGSVFKTGVTEDEIINMVKEVAPKVSGDGGAYELNKPSIGYDLVLPIDKAKSLKDAKEGEVEKQEGPNKIKVISITTSQPLSSFASNRISLIIRKSNPQFLPDDVKTDVDIAKKIEEGKCYSLLTAFPGNPDIPRASEWGGKFAVILPGGKEEMNEGQLYHRGSKGTQTLIIPNDLGEIDVNDFTTALEFAIDGEMSERNYEPGTEYNLNVVDQDGDDPTKIVYFKFKQKGEDVEVDPTSIRVEMDEIYRLNEIVNKVLVKMYKQLNENDSVKDKIYDFLYSDEIKQDTGVTSFTICDEDDWEKVKNYINGRGIGGITGKQSFLANNEDVTEQDFNKYYDEWLDYIEDQRADESRNQQDYNY